MVKKRKLSPKSLWDETDLRAAFQEAGVKESHIRKLYRYSPYTCLHMPHICSLTSRHTDSSLKRPAISYEYAEVASAIFNFSVMKAQAKYLQEFE